MCILSGVGTWLSTTTGNLLRSVPAGLGLHCPRRTQPSYSIPVLPPKQSNSLHTSHGRRTEDSFIYQVSGSSSAGSASVSHRFQQRQQLHALTSVCSGVVYWRVSGSRILQPPCLFIPIAIVNDIQQRSLDRPTPGTSPLHGMHGPIGHQDAPTPNQFALMQAGKDAVFTMSHAVYGMARKTASMLHGRVSTLIAKLYWLGQAVTATIAMQWHIIQAFVEFVCLEATLVREISMRIFHTFAQNEALSLIKALFEIHAEATYQVFIWMLEEEFPEAHVHPVAALLTLSISITARLLAFVFT